MTESTSVDPTVLSRSAQIEKLTSPGERFEIVEEAVDGIPMRVYAAEPRTLREVVLASAAFEDRTFLVYGDERWTFAEHTRLTAGLARLLRDDYRLDKGDRVCVAMRNYPEWAVIYFAAQLLGLVVVPLNAWWTAPELGYAIADSGARIVFADSERAAALTPQLGAPGSPALVEARGGGRCATGARPWADLLTNLDPAATAPEVDVYPDDMATILYTSGTTGTPKGAVGTHRNHCTTLLNTALGAAASHAVAAAGVSRPPDPQAAQPGTLCTFPLFHIAGISRLAYAAQAGAKFATLYKWDRSAARELIRREQLTAVTGVPTVIRQLVEDISASPSDFASLAGIGVGGAAVPPELVRRTTGLAQPISVTNSYGLTETNSAVVSNAGDDCAAHPDSVGRCQPGTDIRVVDPTSGEEVAAGGIGELWFRGPNIVRGYWNRPQDTAASFVGGWFRTGDLGKVVAGFVYVVDRIKDIVIRGGENIYCAEVEAALFEHPAIEDAAIVGVPHDALGEEAVAVVVPRAGMDVSEGDVQRHVARRLAPFKVPARVIVTSDPLPRTASGKVLKRDLRETVAGNARHDH